MRVKGVFILVLTFLFGCGGGGSTLTLKGTLQPLLGNSLEALPDSATIFVQGYDPQLLLARFKTRTSALEPPEFEIPNVPKDENLVFSMTGIGLQSFSTFPLLTNGDEIKIPAIQSGFKTALEVEVVATGGVLGGTTLTSGTGIVFGIIRPDGTCNQSAFSRVLLRNSFEEEPIGVKGPYFWDQTGRIVNTGKFIDEYCRYVFFDVESGVYELRFFSGSNLADVRSVVVLESSLIVGYNVP